jgi:hypothetical protein
MENQIFEENVNRRNMLQSGVKAIGLVGVAALAAQRSQADVGSGNTVLNTAFDVTQYGAVPQRTSAPIYTVTDNAPAFNAAIAAAKAAGGGIVYVPRGFYVLKTSVLVNGNNIRVIGEGRGITYLAGNNISGAVISFNQSVNDNQIINCSLEDLTITGSSSPATANYCVAMLSTAKCTIRNVEFAANLKTDNSLNSSLYIAKSWVNYFCDLHFSNFAPYAHVHIYRFGGGASSNALNFSNCNLTGTGNGAPHGIVIDSDGFDNNPVGEVFNFSGIICQAYQNGTGIWVKRGEDINIQGFYGELNKVDIRLGDSGTGTRSGADGSYATAINIEGWRTWNSTQAAIWLDQCRHVKIGIGTAVITDPSLISANVPRVLFGRATAVFLFARNEKDFPVKFDPTIPAENRAGIMIFDGDAHEYPDWPVVPNKMGLIMKAYSTAAGADTDNSAGTYGQHFKIYVDQTGVVKTEQYSPDANGFLKR